MNDKIDREFTAEKNNSSNIMQRMRLDGKVAYVTGGARGIGKSIATALAQAGAGIVIADLDLQEAEKTAQAIASAEHVKCMAIQVDVTDASQTERLTRFVEEQFGRLDIAVNNAGICINAPAECMTAEQWNKVIAVNLTGVFLTSQAAGKQMIKQKAGGSIINIASMSAHIVNRPQPQCAYNASKAGVIQLTKSLAAEWCDYGIRVNSISPGYMGTELTLHSPDLKPLITKWEDMSPMHRIGKPEELQGMAVYLAGDTSSFTTGGDFVVDGAFTCV